MDFDFNNKTTLGKIKVLMLKGEKGSTGHGALVANSVAEMTDKTQIYVYTGATTADYTFGDWCYWDGSEWVDGGAYNAAVIETDKSLTVEDQAADAKATGDRIDELARMEVLTQTGDMYQGWTANKVISDQTGEIINSDANAACETFIKLPENVGVVTLKSTTYTGFVGTYSSATAAGFIERIQLGTNTTITIDPATVKYIRLAVATSVSNAATISWEWTAPLTQAVLDNTEKFALFAALRSSDATQIVATEEDPQDYNDYTTPGNYINGTTTSLGHTSNLPPGLGAIHRLYVLQTTSAARVVQIIVSNSTTQAVQIYKRIGRKSGNTWDWQFAWNKIVDTSNLGDVLSENEVFNAAANTATAARNGVENLAALEDLTETGDKIPGWMADTNIAVDTGIIGPSTAYSACTTFIKIPDYATTFTYKTTTSSSYVGKYSTNDVSGFIGRETVGTNSELTIDPATVKYIRISVAGSPENAGTLSWEWTTPLTEAVNENVMMARDFSENPGALYTDEDTGILTIDPDLLLVPGYYRIPFDSNAGLNGRRAVIKDAPNEPTRQYTMIIVEKCKRESDTYNVIRQTLINNNYGSAAKPGTEEQKTTYVRYRKGGAHEGSYYWTYWRYFLTNLDLDPDELDEELKTLAALQWTDATQVSATQESPKDYDDYTSPGNYINGSSESVVNTSNLPVGLGATHRLYVLQTTNASRVVQIIIANSTYPVAQIFKRIGTKTDNVWTWRRWTRIIDSDNIINYLDRNTKESYTLPASDFKVGHIIYDPSIANGGKYSDTTNYRISTPDIHIAETDIRISAVDGYALFVYLFADGVYQGTINGKNASVTSATLSAGQQYKLSIAKDGTTATVAEYYDKAKFRNPLQQALVAESITSDPRYIPTDYGVVPTGVFYSGTNDTYDRFLDNSGNPAVLPSSDYSVGEIIYDGEHGGEYSNETNTRISTPNIHTAAENLVIKPSAGYSLFVYLFNNNNEYQGTINNRDESVSSANIAAGQKYKISIGKDETAATVSGYYDKVKSYDMMNAQTSDVYDAFDELLDDPCVTKAEIGVCSDGEQHLYKYDFSPKQAGAVTFNEPIPTIFLVCGQHGYEKASVFSLYYLFKHMISTPFDNPVLNYLRFHCRIICIPVANPWGFNHNTYKNFGTNGIPVNLNRNWSGTWQAPPSEWSDADKEASNQYGGEAAFDQDETARIKEVFDQYAHLITFCIDYHTNGDDQYSHRPQQYNKLNANLMVVDDTSPLQNVMKSASRYHIREITSHFVTEYGLKYTPGTALWTPPVCGYISAGADHSVGTARDFFTEQNKLGLTFETFPGFPVDSNNPAYKTYAPYTPDVIKASEELISNYIIAIFNYLNKS